MMKTGLPPMSESFSVYQINFADGFSYVGHTGLAWEERIEVHKRCPSNSVLTVKLLTEPYTAELISTHNDRRAACAEEREIAKSLDKPLNVRVPTLNRRWRGLRLDNALSPQHFHDAAEKLRDCVCYSVYRLRFDDGLEYVNRTSLSVDERIEIHKTNYSNALLCCKLKSEPYTAEVISTHTDKKSACAAARDVVRALSHPINAYLPAMPPIYRAQRLPNAPSPTVLREAAAKLQSGTRVCADCGSTELAVDATGKTLSRCEECRREHNLFCRGKPYWKRSRKRREKLKQCRVCGGQPLAVSDKGTLTLCQPCRVKHNARRRKQSQLINNPDRQPAVV